MSAPYPRRRWRFASASAVSATLLAAVAGCGEPSHAGNAAAAAPAAGSHGSVTESEASATTAPVVAGTPASAGVQTTGLSTISTSGALPCCAASSALFVRSVVS